MKRRLLIGRAFFGAISAGVFSASGWLMGTRTLTMPAWQWTYPSSCISGASDCSCTVRQGATCVLYTSCPPGGGQYQSRCATYEYMDIACCTNYPDQICALANRTWPCGSCAGCE
jgi:hypothetical protein